MQIFAACAVNQTLIQQWHRVANHKGAQHQSLFPVHCAWTCFCEHTFWLTQLHRYSCPHSPISHLHVFSFIHFFVHSGLLTDLLTISITQQTSHPPLSFTHFSLFALSRHLPSCLLTHFLISLLTPFLYYCLTHFLTYSHAYKKTVNHQPIVQTLECSKAHSMNHDSIFQSSNYWCLVGTLDGWIIGLFNQLFSHSAIQSFSHSSKHTIQTINHWIQHSIIPSVTEPNNQEASTSTGEIFFDESGDQKTMIQLFNKSISQRLKLSHRYSVEFVSVS